MSDVQALYIFLRKPVTSEMIQFLVSTTNSIIQVTPSATTTPIPSLYQFIQNLINYSHVQTPTLMSTLVYLNRLRLKIPPNSTGMETTRHRIFLGSLILAAKNLNDSSPMNKHWCKYTDGLLSLKDINALEVELIDYLGWSNLRIEMTDLIDSLNWFLKPIKSKLRKQYDAKLQKTITTTNLHKYTTTAPPQPSYTQLSTPTSSRSSSIDNNIPPSNSLPSLISSTSTNSINTQYSSNSMMTSSTSCNSISSIPNTTLSPTKPLTLKPQSQRPYPPTPPKSNLPSPLIQHKKLLTPISIHATPSTNYTTSNPTSTTSSTFTIQPTTTASTPTSATTTSTTFLKPLRLKSSIHSLRSHKSTESLKPHNHTHHGLRQFKSNSSLKSFIHGNNGHSNSNLGHAHSKTNSGIPNNGYVGRNMINIPLVGVNNDNKENLAGYGNRDNGVRIVGSTTSGDYF